MNKPLVSVIMPAYNCEKYIRRAIDSILNQTYANLEVLVADDASKDKTKRIIDTYSDPRVVRYHNDTNLGYLKTCNKLFSQAKGDFVTFQDSDDYSELNRIELQLKEFDNDPELSVCGTDYITLNYNGKKTNKSDFPRQHESIMSNIASGKFTIIPNSFLLKREVLQTVGGYNDYFDRIGAEDYYWTWLIMEKYKLTNINKPLYFYQNNQNSISGNLSDNYRKMFSPKIVCFLISQRIHTGCDSLSGGNKNELTEFVSKETEPYVRDNCFHFKNLARRYYYEGRKNDARKLQLHVCLKQCNIQNFRDLIYYLRK